MSDTAAVYALIGRGDWQRAKARCQELLSEHGESAALHHALGVCLYSSGSVDEALTHLRRAVDIDPHSHKWSRDAAALSANAGRWDDAVDLMSPVNAELDIDALMLYLMAGIAAHRSAGVLTHLTPSALSRLRETSKGRCALGRSFAAARRYVEAEIELGECLRLSPDNADGHEALAVLCEETDRRDEALVPWRRCAQLRPRNLYAQIRLALAYLDTGQFEASRAIRKRAEAFGLQDATHHAACLYMMLSDPEEVGTALVEAARKPFVGKTTAARPRRSARSRLRVGYIGGRFHMTPSYYFTHPFLSTHDRSAVEVFLYACAPEASEAASYYASLADHCRLVSGLDDRDLRQVLEKDELDVLVHMPGHFSYSKLEMLCDRIAPIQAAYPHFPASTGCPGVDYLITDAWTSPPGTEAEYSERLWRIPTGYLAFVTPKDGPHVSRSRRREGAPPVFGVFQRPAKFNAKIWDAAAEILARVPDALLLVQNSNPELDRADSPTSRAMARGFADRGIDPARLKLRGPVPYLEHLALAGSVDVTLDTFPYGGQTTTFESLWMGVPVVTLAYPSHAGRVSAAILTRAGHSDWVGGSIDEYVDAAVSLATNVEELISLRQRLRNEFVEAGFTDGRSVSLGLERAYQESAEVPHA